MYKVQSKIRRFLKWSCSAAGKPITFVIALSFLVFWLIVGLIWGFSTDWLLIINTIGTINAALMVLIIQNTQNRESKALHLKIDHIIYVIKEAEKRFIAIEEIEEEELEIIRKELIQKKLSSMRNQ